MLQSKFSNWKILDEQKTFEIRRFYRNRNSTVFTAASVVKEHIFQLDPEYIWCPESTFTTYNRGLGKLIKTYKSKGKENINLEKRPGIFENFDTDDFENVFGTNTGGPTKDKKELKRDPIKVFESCTELMKDPEQIVWMKKIMKKALDYYYMFGMCPFRMVVGCDKNPKLVIPSMEEGHFIARINPENSIKEVQWLSKSNLRTGGMNLEPDDTVGVYCWESFEPQLDVTSMQTPYTSAVARLIGPYKEFKKFVKNA